MVLRYEEQARPRIIKSRDDAPTKGRFWIEPDSGRVVQSELVFESGGASVTVTVRYAPQPTVDLWMPVSMEEQYRLARGEMVEGHATYSNFRKFRVDVSTMIKSP